jgi:hypothetical protein
MINVIYEAINRLGGVSRIGRLAGEFDVGMQEWELSSLEALYSFVFPPLFREFMKEFGACGFGPPDGNYTIMLPWNVPIPHHITNHKYTSYGTFYGRAAMPQMAFRLSWQLEMFQGRMPGEIIPIADCDGNKVCLGVRSDCFNRVYYWDSETEPQDEEDYLADFGGQMPREVKWQNIFLVADSFEQFVMSLRRLDE